MLGWRQLWPHPAVLLLPLLFAMHIGASVACASAPAELTRALWINGVALSLRPQLFDAAPDDVAMAVEREWRGQPHLGPIRRMRLGTQVILSRQQANVHETLQLRAGSRGGTEGLWGRSDLQRPLRVIPSAPIPLPPRSRVALTIESIDAGRNAVQVLGRTNTSARTTLLWLESRARARGFSPAPDPDAKLRRGAVAWFTRGAEELVIHVSRGRGGARFLLHHTQPVRVA